MQLIYVILFENRKGYNHDFRSEIERSFKRFVWTDVYYIQIRRGIHLNSLKAR